MPHDVAAGRRHDSRRDAGAAVELATDRSLPRPALHAFRARQRNSSSPYLAAFARRGRRLWSVGVCVRRLSRRCETRSVASVAAGPAWFRRLTLLVHLSICRKSAADQPRTAGGSRLDRTRSAWKRCPLELTPSITRRSSARSCRCCLKGRNFLRSASPNARSRYENFRRENQWWV